jgi:lipopolysaccharide biosynthesis regulator YciM
MKHTSVVFKVTKPADGLLAVHVRCCGDSTTDSVLTLHQLHRSNEEIDADIAVHQARVENLHEENIRVSEHLARLTGVKVDCGCK